MRIKISIPGIAFVDLSQFTGTSDGLFQGDIFFVDNQERDADAWFISEDVWFGDNTCVVPANEVHFLTAEASYHLEKFLNKPAEKFFRQFSTVHSCHPIDIPHYQHSAPFLPWMVNSNHGTVLSPHERDINQLRKPLRVEKVRKMSMICSMQAGTPEHRLRIAFARAVEREFGNAIDWFGNGVNEVAEKWDALAPYARTIVLENRFAPGLFTEKIIDPYLTETVPIYWGAPDIEKYLPVRSSHQLNLYDFAGSLRTIEELIDQPVSDEEKADLLSGKSAALDELHFLKRISDIARKATTDSPSERRLIELNPAETFLDQRKPNLRGQLGRAVTGIVRATSSLFR